MSLADGRPPYTEAEIAFTAKAILSGEAAGIWLQTDAAKKVWNAAETLQLLLGGTIWVCAFEKDREADPTKKCRFDAASARRLFLEVRRQEVAAMKAVAATEISIARMIDRHEKRRAKNVNGGAKSYLARPR